MYIVFRHMINRMRLLVSFYFTTLYFSYKKGEFGDIFQAFISAFCSAFRIRVHKTSTNHTAAQSSPAKLMISL